MLKGHRIKTGKMFFSFHSFFKCHLIFTVSGARTSIDLGKYYYRIMTRTHVLTHSGEVYLQVKSEVLSLFKEVVQNEFPHKVWV